MHQDAPRGRAALARGTDRAEYNGRHDDFEIGGFIDDDGVVAAQFQQALAQSLRHSHAMCRPTWVDPVNDTRATRRSSTNRVARCVPESMNI
jgi:hypothetical protein